MRLARPLIAATLALLNTGQITAARADIAKGPFLQNPRPGELTICWVSSTPSVGSVTLKRPDGSGRDRTVVERKPVQYHRVRVTGLKAYTRYPYTVTCGGERQSGIATTAARGKTPFHFVVYGDTRTQPQRHAEVLAAMAKFSPDFVVQTGDLVSDGRVESQWTEFFQIGAPVLSTAPYLPTLGNHERDGEAYLRYFGVPRDYSFDYGNAHFTSVDLTRPQAEAAAQDAWLARDLAAHQHFTWRFVYFHYPLYSCTDSPSRRTGAEEVRDRLEPILRAGHVQMVFAGHDHNYQRHMVDGMGFIVAGGGGAPLYPIKADTPYVVAAKMAYHYCELSVDGPALHLRTVEPNGAVIDNVTFRTDGRRLLPAK